MARITGLGGIFFKCADVAATKKWYHKHLELPVDNYGCTFWQEPAAPGAQRTSQQWSPFKSDTDYFNPGQQEYMINYRVDNLEELLIYLKSEEITVVGDMQVFDYGKFAWIIDIDDRKVELWEPANEHLFEQQ